MSSEWISHNICLNFDSLIHIFRFVLLVHSNTMQAALALQKKQQEAQQMACRIYVGSLNYDLDEEVIRVPFSVFGTITKIDMPKVRIAQSDS